MSFPSNVAEHYNKIERNLENRNDSPIIQLRKFNNWIKSVLIQMETSKLKTTGKISVLDLCCGKGGDLQKWSKLDSPSRLDEYLGVDFAKKSIEEAAKRHLQMKHAFPASFHVADVWMVSNINDLFTNIVSFISKIRLKTELPLNHSFDIVSCQFAFHYAFESEEKARMGLLNVSENLKEGGRFIGVIPDSNMIL